jgi:hypothetical protein
MRSRMCLLAVLALFAQAARADRYPDTGDRQHLPDQEHAARTDAHVKRGGHSLTYHGGPVIHSARVVAIFWGPSWGTGGADANTANHIISFLAQLGTSTHWLPITQYGDSTGTVQTTSLGPVTYFDPSAPPTDVTDAIAQTEVSSYLSQAGVQFDPSTVYEVFLPPPSYSTDGSQSSCGGPNLSYCAYHGHFTSGLDDVKYAVIPWPSCGSCQSSGFTSGQNFDHFTCHETREAVTDPDFSAWFDKMGNEADEKCLWSPAPFIDSGFGYQYEWSNSAGGCVQ